MALNKKDLQENNKIVISEITTTFTKEVGLLRLEINQRFDAQNDKIQSNHKEILTKINEVKQMESEDILALSDDIVRIKKHVGIK